MSEVRGSLVKFGIFALIMIVLTAALFAIFGQYRSGSTQSYSAVFTDASSLEPGDSVRVAGIRVGTVADVTLQPDNTVVVSFDADRNVPLTSGTKVAVRFLNLVGDRYLELMDGPGSSKIQPPGSRIGIDRTEPALDLDLLLGGLRPVVQGLNPQDVNALTNSLIQIFQGRSGDVESLFARTSEFTTAVAANRETVQQLIDHLNGTVTTLADGGDQFADTVSKLETLVTALAQDRDPIGEAIGALEDGTASLADLLTQMRSPLAGTVDQLTRMAPLISNEEDLARMDLSLQKAPANYRKLVRLGAYGSWLNQYLCGMSVRVSDLQGQTAVFPWIMQDTGRCAEP
ncbi:MCE family protein [Mycolicibacterium sp. P9-64]|uniref:MCE family protein n=1 Tax=Mycolicibacterium sp. P9-64 TaxID=2024612 RepID=UPI0011EF6356|nr:MlaD family protein [Mycolicibacterium sp. P9-64]KAA0084593.1 MCE family protein [Mycolicibacterium sp. P9-64]